MRLRIQSTLLGFERVLARWPWLLLAHAVPVFVLLSPVLIGGYAFQEAPNFSYVQFSSYTIPKLLSGEAFWNPWNFNGSLLFFIDGFGLSPLVHLFASLLPPFHDLHWFTYLHVVLGGFFCSLYLRRLGISAIGAWVGGTTYLAGNWWIVPHTYYVGVLPLLPLLAWNILDAQRYPFRASLLGALLMGYAWYSTIVQMPVYLTVALLAGTVAMMLQARAKGWKAWIQPLLHCTITTVSGALLGLVKILPNLMSAALSFRAGGLPLETSAVEPIPFPALVHYLFPYANAPFLDFGWGKLFGLYLGTFGLVFLLIGMFHHRKHTRLWTLAYLLILLIALEHSPLFAFIQGTPPFSYFRGMGRWTLLGNFAAGVICAYGFEALVQEQAERIRRTVARVTSALGLLLLLGIVGGIVTLLWIAETHSPLFKQIENLAIATLLNPKSLSPLLALLLVAWALQERTWQRLAIVRSPTLALLSGATTVLVLLPHIPLYHLSELTAPVQMATFLRGKQGLTHTVFAEFEQEELFPHGLSAMDYLTWEREHLPPNLGVGERVKTLSYHDRIMNRRMARLAAWVGASHVIAPKEDQLLEMKLQRQEKLALLLQRKDILDILGVRYLISAFPLPFPTFEKVFETTATSFRIPIAIYENLAARPLAYFANNVEVMEVDEARAIEKLMSWRWPGRKSLLECNPVSLCTFQEVKGKGTVRVIEEQSSRLILKTESNSPQWLIVTVNHLPGWIVTVDSERVMPVTANGSFFGIPIPAGPHTVTFRYSLGELLAYSIKHVQLP